MGTFHLAFCWDGPCPQLKENTMFDTLIINALENACLSDGDLTHELQNALLRNSLLDVDAPLDLPLYHASDLSDPFIQ